MNKSNQIIEDLKLVDHLIEKVSKRIEQEQNYLQYLIERETQLQTELFKLKGL